MAENETTAAPASGAERQTASDGGKPIPLRRLRRSSFVGHPARPIGAGRTWLYQALHTTLVSLRTNGPLVAASVLCAAVALTLIGSSLLVREGVDNATVRWRGGVETIVFLEPGASQSFADQIGTELRADPGVRDATFASQVAAHDEFKVMFRNSPELVDNVGAEALPASWRVVPHEHLSPEQVAAIGEKFRGRPGIYEVVYARDAVESVLRVTTLIERALLGAAIVLGSVALLLVWTTCRAAAWSRRDELAVMRQLGAPRALVRAPFIAEGAIAGGVGAAVAAVIVTMLSDVVQRAVVEGASLAILRNFSVTSESVRQIAVLLVVAGVVAGALGATAAVQRHVTDRPKRSRRAQRALAATEHH